MKIVMRDGRVFQGTALQIVKAMQDIAFGVEDFERTDEVEPLKAVEAEENHPPHERRLRWGDEGGNDTDRSFSAIDAFMWERRHASFCHEDRRGRSDRSSSALGAFERARGRCRSSFPRGLAPANRISRTEVRRHRRSSHPGVAEEALSGRRGARTSVRP